MERSVNYSDLRPLSEQLSTTNIQTLARLETILGFAEGHTLLFARCNASTLRDQIIAILAERLTAQSVAIYRLSLSEPTHDLREQIKAILPAGLKEDEPAILIITGLEYSIPYETPEAPMLAELNLGRELLQLAAPLPILFWLPDYAITALTRYPLDFWSWSSGLFEFETDLQHHERSYQQYVQPDQSFRAMNNLTREQKLRRRRILEGLLADYEIQMDSDDRIRRIQPTQQEHLLLYLQLGQIHLVLEEYSQAQQYYETALEMAEEFGDTAKRASILNCLGLVYDSLGDKREALCYFSLQQVGNKNGEATVLNNMGLVYNWLGENDEALRYFNQALPMHQAVGNKAMEATTLHNLGYVYNSLGDMEETLCYYNLSLYLRQQVGDKAGEAITLNYMGSLYNRLGDGKKALHYYSLALSLRQELGDTKDEAVILTNIGAVRYYNLALPLLQQMKDVWNESIQHCNIAFVHRDRGELEKAVTHLEQAVAIDEKIGHPDLERDQAILEEARAMLAEKANG